MVQENRERAKTFENIKIALLTEVKKICLTLEKNEAESQNKILRISKNFKDIISYITSGYEKERLSYQLKNENLRKVEKTLRETVKKHKDMEDMVELLQNELKRTRQQFRSNN